jgi:hypothetical protein
VGNSQSNRDQGQDSNENIEKTVLDIPEEYNLNKLNTTQLKWLDIGEFQTIYDIVRRNVAANVIYSVLSSPFK